MSLGSQRCCTGLPKRSNPSHQSPHVSLASFAASTWWPLNCVDPRRLFGFFDDSLQSEITRCVIAFPCNVGDTVTVKSASLERRQTSAPGYLTESELISLMEKHGIGTDASIPVHINNICEVSHSPLFPLVFLTLLTRLINHVHLMRHFQYTVSMQKFLESMVSNV